MITICPSCNRQFRIYARQLSAASGQVQCGFCGAQFNALERLHDQPLQTQTGGQTDGPGFDVPESAVAGNPGSTAGGPVTRATVPDNPSILQDPDLARDLLLPAPRQASRSRIATVLWSLGVVGLLLAATVQLAWFNRDLLLARYPEYVPQVKQLCERYHCELVRDRNLDAIVLVNRDVRNHPRYNDLLLVNITIENRSDKPQPYPGIQFMLFDSNGSMTGFRRLQPAEYLEPGARIDAGMQPRLPLHLVLEVAETSETPVGFEFGFF